MSKMSARAHRLLDQAVAAYRAHGPWPPDACVDLFVEGLGGNMTETLRSVLTAAFQATELGSKDVAGVRTGSVQATIRQREVESPMKPDTVRVSAATVGSTAVRLDRASYLTVTLSLSKYRQVAASKALKDAKTQLPTESKGAVFIELADSPSVKQKISELIAGPTYAHIPWVSVWAFGEPAWAVWRDGQQFDGRLMA